MTLVRFKAANHPQQSGRRGADDDVDDRWTPTRMWEIWNREFQFTLDAAASARNHKCARYFTLETDGLAQPWTGETVWCNPPFSNLGAWVEKALREVRDNGCLKVVMLLPANRTEQRWWQMFVEPVRDRGLGISTRFLPHRINFASHEHPDGKSKSSAPFGCVLVIIDGRAK